jgi:hypothetical protein
MVKKNSESTQIVPIMWAVFHIQQDFFTFPLKGVAASSKLWPLHLNPGKSLKLPVPPGKSTVSA